MTKQVINTNSSLENYVFGKVQPQAVPVEEAILGAIMLDKEGLPTVLDILSEESFYNPAHAKIYAACMSLFERSIPIDLLTVEKELKVLGTLEEVGGAYYLVELTNRAASAANIEHHARIVAQEAIKRAIIRISTEAINAAYDPSVDVFDLVDSTESAIFQSLQGVVSKEAKKVDTVTSKVLKQIEEVSQNEDSIVGIPSGLKAIDKKMKGWRNGSLHIIAGRPGMGKTSYVLNLAMEAAKAGHGVAMFSLEMTELELTEKLISMQSGISSSKLDTGKLTDEEWQNLQVGIEKVNDLDIFIDDSSTLSPFEIRAKSRRLKMQHDIKLVIVDYLQLMKGDEKKSGNREQEVASISRSLKQLAKELDVPVIALSQLSRAVELRGGSKRPMLSDLRESGSLEQDANIVSFIYRPEYYGIVEDEEGNSLIGLTEIIFAKNRGGSTGTVKIQWDERCTKFSDIPDVDLEGFDEKIQKQNAAYIENPKRMNNDDIPF